MSVDDGGKKYPLGDFWEYHDGYDIVRSNNRIVALVVVSRAQSTAKELRFYSWVKRGEEWRKFRSWALSQNWRATKLRHAPTGPML